MTICILYYCTYVLNIHMLGFSLQNLNLKWSNISYYVKVAYLCTSKEHTYASNVMRDFFCKKKYYILKNAHLKEKITLMRGNFYIF